MNFEYYYLCTKISSLEKRCKELEYENKLLKEDKSSLFDDLKSVLSKVKCGTDGSYYYYRPKLLPPSPGSGKDDDADMFSHNQPISFFKNGIFDQSAFESSSTLDQLQFVQQMVEKLGEKKTGMNNLSENIDTLLEQVIQNKMEMTKSSQNVDDIMKQVYTLIKMMKKT